MFDILQTTGILWKNRLWNWWPIQEPNIHETRVHASQLLVYIFKRIYRMNLLWLLTFLQCLVVLYFRLGGGWTEAIKYNISFLMWQGIDKCHLLIIILRWKWKPLFDTLYSSFIIQVSCCGVNQTWVLLFSQCIKCVVFSINTLLILQVAGAPAARLDAVGETSRSHVMSDKELEESLAKLKAT